MWTDWRYVPLCAAISSAIMLWAVLNFSYFRHWKEGSKEIWNMQALHGLTSACTGTPQWWWRSNILLAGWGWGWSHMAHLWSTWCHFPTLVSHTLCWRTQRYCLKKEPWTAEPRHYCAECHHPIGLEWRRFRHCARCKRVWMQMYLGGGGGALAPCPPPLERFEIHCRAPLSMCLRSVSLTSPQVTKFPRPSPSISACCKQSKTGGCKGLGMRLCHIRITSSVTAVLWHDITVRVNCKEETESVIHYVHEASRNIGSRENDCTVVKVQPSW